MGDVSLVGVHQVLPCAISGLLELLRVRSLTAGVSFPTSDPSFCGEPCAQVSCKSKVDCRLQIGAPTGYPAACYDSTPSLSCQFLHSLGNSDSSLDLQ